MEVVESRTPEKEPYPRVDLVQVPPVHEVAYLEAQHEESASVHDEEAERSQMPVERFEPREEEVK